MKIKILEYKQIRGNNVKVQSHNYRKGKWKKNPNYLLHKRNSTNENMIVCGVDLSSVKEYTRVVKE
jgi:hypothetical protein